MRFAAIAAALVAAPASAESGERGFYVGADVAGLDASAGKQYGLLFGTPSIIFRDLPDTAATQGVDVSWGAQFGYRINRNLAIELGYTDFGTMAVHETYDLSPLIPAVFERDLTFSASGPSLSWLGVIPAGEHFEAFVRVGVLHADQSLHRSFGSPRKPNTSAAVSLFGLGAVFHASEHWAARMEYQRIGELSGRGVGGDPGSVGPIRIRRYGVGVTYQF